MLFTGWIIVVTCLSLECDVFPKHPVIVYPTSASCERALKAFYTEWIPQTGAYKFNCVNTH